MKYILPIIIVIAFSCKKKENISITTDFTAQAKSAGIEVGHQYSMGSKYSPMLSKVTFNSNSTITEYVGTDTFIYPVHVNLKTDYSKSLINNGTALQVWSDYDSTLTKISFRIYNMVEPYTFDTVYIGTFLSGDMVKNSMPTLGGIVNHFNSYVFFTY